MHWCRLVTPHTLEIGVRVTPKASHEAMGGIFDDGKNQWLKIRVSAPPEDGKANEAVIALLAAYLGIAKSSIALISGDTHRHKCLRILGTASVLAEKLARIAAET